MRALWPSADISPQFHVWSSLEQFFVPCSCSALMIYTIILAQDQTGVSSPPHPVSPILRVCYYGNYSCFTLCLVRSLSGFDTVTKLLNCLNLIWNDGWSFFSRSLWFFLSISVLLREHQLCLTWSSTMSQPRIWTSPSTSTLAHEDGKPQLIWWGRWEIDLPCSGASRKEEIWIYLCMHQK